LTYSIIFSKNLACIFKIFNICDMSEDFLFFYFFFIHLIHNIHALHFLILICIYPYDFYWLSFSSLLQTSYAMDCIRKCERFVLLTMGGSSKQWFSEEVCFQSDLVSKFWHLHNDINQIFAPKILQSLPKLTVVLLFKWSVYNCDNKLKIKSRACFQNYCHCSAWKFEIQHFGQRISQKIDN
jgi:hypothetical protein